MIPMVDLKTQYQALKKEIDDAVGKVLENTQFILGPDVQTFEREAAQYLNVNHAVSCASGTDALHLALRAAGIRAGDEVITSAFTFIATAEAIRYLGAVPVFVDIDPQTFNLDPAKVDAAVTGRTRAVLPVHLFGQPADMPALMETAERYDLKVIEDCAQSFGADIDGRMTGGIGLAGCHSFFPSKNLGCYGDGGMVTTNDDSLADRLRQLRNHGSRERYHHDIIGYNSRLDELQAAILRVKLKYIDQFNAGRRRAAHRYSEGLKDYVTPPHEDGLGTHVYHQYTILTDHRETIMQALSDKHIANAIYYPIPLHRQRVFEQDYPHLSLPVTEEVSRRCLSLPIFPEMLDEQVDTVVATIANAL